MNSKLSEDYHIDGDVYCTVKYTLNVEPGELIIDRMARRRVCPNCKRTYSIDPSLPYEQRYCTECGTELIIRDDDKPETVAHRLEVYAEQTYPLIEFFREKELLSCIDGTGTVDGVAESIFALFEEQ